MAQIEGREREKERGVVALHVEVVAMVASGVFYNAQETMEKRGYELRTLSCCGGHCTSLVAYLQQKRKRLVSLHLNEVVANRINLCQKKEKEEGIAVVPTFVGVENENGPLISFFFFQLNLETR